jgi:ABC-type branched-subunit amino acid transport system ATPase component
LDALSANNLHAYYGKAHILQGVDLTVGEGAVVGLLGRNGVGKTTLLRAIMHLVPRVEGEVALFGHSLRTLSPDARARAGIAYMSQDLRVFPDLSVQENCQVAANAVPSPLTLDEVVMIIPELKEMLKRPAGRLSGGQQQLVALGRSLIMNCRIVLMDEPTEGLMPRLVQRIKEIILALVARSVAVLLVEQNVDLGLSVCSSLYVLEKGRIVTSGTPDELKHSGLLEHYLGVRAEA